MSITKKKTKVLLIDDDTLFGQIIMASLKVAGFDAYYQSSLTAIKHTINEINPNIIILDVEIGDKNGIDAMPEILTLFGNIPVIFVSSHTDGPIAARAIEAGGTAYLKKPFETEELIAYINRHAADMNRQIYFGNCFLNINDHSLYHNVMLVKQLSSAELKFISLLVTNINSVVSREDINSFVWENKKVSEHSTNNYIARIRSYIADDKMLELVTIPKMGYKLISKIKQ